MEELQYRYDLLQAVNKKLTDSEKMYRMICESSDCAFLHFDFETGRVSSLGKWSLFFPFEIQSNSDYLFVLDYINENSLADLKTLFQLENTGAEKKSVLCLHRNKKQYLEFTATCSYTESDHIPVSKIIKITDISRIQLQEDELKYLAYFDPISNLYNRNSFVRKLGEWIREANENNGLVSIIHICIDDFRQISDSSGLVTGDELVQGLANFLKEYFAEHDNILLSRFYADLFYIAVKNPCGNTSVDSICDAFRKRMEAPFLLTNGTCLNITISIGVAEYPESARTTLELINFSEIALYKAQQLGHNSIVYFNTPILHDFLTTIEIDRKLKMAVEHKDFFLYFQPQFNAKTGRLRGVEALLRWIDEKGNSISPTDFIPIAEKNGSIVPLGKWVIEESIRIYANWKEHYKYPFILSINISALQFRRTDFVNHLLSILKLNHVFPECIELEITESVLIEDFKDVVGKMNVLHDIGIKVSMDDFGTGYSSLAYLKGLPIDTLKIDKSFIDALNKDDASKIITESIVTMVKKLGYETVAEGVETDEQLGYLKK